MFACRSLSPRRGTSVRSPMFPAQDSFRTLLVAPQADCRLPLGEVCLLAGLLEIQTKIIIVVEVERPLWSEEGEPASQDRPVPNLPADADVIAAKILQHRSRYAATQNGVRVSSAARE